VNSILELYHREIRENPQTWEEGMRVERVGKVIRLVSTRPHEATNMVVCTDLDETSVDGAIQDQVGYFGNLGHSFEWKLHEYDQPVDLRKRLTAAGFEPQGTETLVAIEAAAVKESSLGSYEIRRVTRESELDDVFEVNYTVYNDRDPYLKESFKQQMKDTPERLSVFAVYDGKKAVACAWTFYGPSKYFAGLFGGSTLKEYRGRGLYRALVAERAREARERECRYLTVDAAPTSCPILLGMGFEALTGMQGFVKFA
jgi:GNAT superfamily N-acetyltransferase